MHAPFALQMIETNGIRLRAAIEGEGPLVIMVHGWPELWYSWRHQIGPIAKAGYRVVAPDVRGYGGSDRPADVHAYDMASLMADVIGLIDALDERTAILVGHDWGAPICWNTAAQYPERVTAVAGLSVPYPRRGEVSGIELWRRLYRDRFFYQLYFQEVGPAERELDADVRTSLRKIYFALSGDAPGEDPWLQGPEANDLLDGLVDPDPFPAWLPEADLDYLVQSFEETGFHAPLNRYRNQDRDFEILPDLGVPRITQPSCFIAGARDAVRHFVPGRDIYENPGRSCDDFRLALIIDNAGHWVQQEAPAEVTRALLEFLSGLD